MVVVSGDFNHTAEFFADHSAGLNIFSASSGTMAAGDFGNRDKPIDLVVSNKSDASMRVLDNFMSVAPSATADLSITVDLSKEVPSAEGPPPLKRLGPSHTGRL